MNIVAIIVFVAMGRRVSRKNVNYQKLEGPSDDEFICEFAYFRVPI